MKQWNNLTIKIILTGGGTAGHVWPLLAVWEELRALGYKYKFKFLYLGSREGPEEKLVRKYKIPYKGIFSGKLRRYFDLRNLIDPFKMIIGFFQSLDIIWSFKPDIIFAKGGYVTFPVVLAGWILRIPIITHESDVVMGLANRLEAKLARKTCVGFPVQFYQDLPLSKIVYTGTPIRKEFLEIRVSKCEVGGALRRSYYVKRSTKRITHIEQRSTVLITGGSQGARFINQTVAAIMSELTKKYNIIHLCGKNDYQWLVKNKWPDYELYDFTDKMPELMRKSDLIISRAGANTLIEISCLGKPSVLIPLPSAAHNHQVKNAEIYHKKNAAVVVSEKGLTPDNLKDIIERLMEDKDLLRDLGNQAKSLAQPDAAEAIAEEILKILR